VAASTASSRIETRALRRRTDARPLAQPCEPDADPQIDSIRNIARLQALAGVGWRLGRAERTRKVSTRTMMAHRFASEFPAGRVIRQRLDPPRRTSGDGQQPARSAEAESLFRKGADQQHPPPAGGADPLRGEIAALRQQQADDVAHMGQKARACENAR
jgi:hypothetical protein